MSRQTIWWIWSTSVLVLRMLIPGYHFFYSFQFWFAILLQSLTASPGKFLQFYHNFRRVWPPLSIPLSIPKSWLKRGPRPPLRTSPKALPGLTLRHRLSCCLRPQATRCPAPRPCQAAERHLPPTHCHPRIPPPVCLLFEFAETHSIPLAFSFSFFCSFVSNYIFKKSFFILKINGRIVAMLGRSMEMWILVSFFLWYVCFPFHSVLPSVTHCIFEDDLHPDQDYHQQVIYLGRVPRK